MAILKVLLEFLTWGRTPSFTGSSLRVNSEHIPTISGLAPVPRDTAGQDTEAKQPLGGWAACVLLLVLLTEHLRQVQASISPLPFVEMSPLLVSRDV